MHHIYVKKDMKQRVPPSDHCGTLHPNAGRHPCKKGKTPCTSAPCSHRVWQNETTFHREHKCSVALLSALPSASVSVFWTGFVLLLCQDVVGLNRWEERVYQWRTLRLCSSKVFPRLVHYKRKRFVSVITEIARGASSVEIRRLGAWKGRCVPAAVTAAREMMSVLRMRAGGGWWWYP